MQHGIGYTNFAEIVQGSGVEDKVCLGSVPAEMFRENSAVVAKSDIVICSLVIFVADRLVQALCGIEVSLRKLTRVFLFAF